MRIVPLISLGLVLACASLSATAGGDVYQWKDAKGVTQYTSTPPPNGAYKVRTIRNDGSAPIATTAAAPAETPACTNARQNQALLQGKSDVQIDSDGDGKGDKVLSADERANQMQLAQASIKVNCTAPVAAATTP